MTTKSSQMKNMQVSDMSPMIGRTVTFNNNLFLKLTPNGIPPTQPLLHLLLKHSNASPQSAGDVTKNHLVPRCWLSIDLLHYQSYLIPHPQSPKILLDQAGRVPESEPRSKAPFG